MNSSEYATNATIMRNNASPSRTLLGFRPDLRNTLFFLLFLPLLAWTMFSFVKIIRKVNDVRSRTGDGANLTSRTATFCWFVVSIVAPIVHLTRLSMGQIHQTTSKARFLSLFALHWSWRRKFQQSAAKVSAWIDYVSRLGTGERVPLEEVPVFDEDDREYIREVVEENITLHTAEKSLAEKSAWLLIFSQLVLIYVILLAGSYAAEEVLENGLKTDVEVGKVLTEWLANYVLLFVGFLQLTSRGSVLNALTGICSGAFSTMNDEERGAVVGLYIAMADERIEGLRREGSYARVWMDGKVWTAPRIKSALLAGVGEEFMVVEGEGGWEIKWGMRDDEVEVRLVGE